MQPDTSTPTRRALRNWMNRFERPRREPAPPPPTLAPRSRDPYSDPHTRREFVDGGPLEAREPEALSFVERHGDDPRIIAAIRETEAALYPESLKAFKAAQLRESSITSATAATERQAEIANARLAYEEVEARHSCGLATAEDLATARREFEDVHTDRASVLTRLLIKHRVLLGEVHRARRARREESRIDAKEQLRARVASDVLPLLRQLMAAMADLQPLIAATHNRRAAPAWRWAVHSLTPSKLRPVLDLLERFCGTAAPASAPPPPARRGRKDVAA